MGIWDCLNGLVTVEITSADPAAAISALHERGILLEKICYVDELTFQFQIIRQSLKKVEQLSVKRGEKFRILKRHGLYFQMISLLKRPVMITGLMIVLLLTIFLPTRILFFRIEGNVKVPQNQILEAIFNCGISFGAERHEIRSEKVKNRLLEEIPNLEWVGINTAGCVATISVRERHDTLDSKQPSGVSSIIAACDGVIQELVVTAGSAVCRPGQVVKAGQVLISGYTDCGISIRAERAKGEVYATTSHQITCVKPKNEALRAAQTEIKQKYGLIIGKKRINFSEYSGILDVSCVKMYEENYLTLPGGFVLPIGIVKETWVYYESSSETINVQQDENAICHYAHVYLQSQMLSGQILSKTESVIREDGYLRLSGEYTCLEMIGRERLEEIIAP